MPKKTLSAILESKNDYLVVVKKNQKTLYKQIYFHTKSITPTLEFKQTETTRDRLTHRIIKVFTPPMSIDPRWVGVNCVVSVFRFRIYGIDSMTEAIDTLANNLKLIKKTLKLLLLLLLLPTP